jgi:exosortase/archaeosortase
LSPINIGWIVLACIFGGAPIGVVLRRILPEHHLSSDSKDVIKLAMGLTATMAALVLALLIASAKSSYDAQRSEVTQFIFAIYFIWFEINDRMGDRALWSLFFEKPRNAEGSSRHAD